MVTGAYHKWQGGRYFSLQLGTAMEGMCRFGQETHRIRIIDGNGNFRCGDKPQFVVRNGRMRMTGDGDTLELMSAIRSATSSSSR